MQAEEGKRETERLKAQYENERKRRWRLLEEKGDIEQVVKELYGWDEASAASSAGGTPGGPAGTPALGAPPKTAVMLLVADTPGADSAPAASTSTLNVPVGADIGAWVAKYRQSCVHMQQAKEHR